MINFQLNHKPQKSITLSFLNIIFHSYFTDYESYLIQLLKFFLDSAYLILNLSNLTFHCCNLCIVFFNLTSYRESLQMYQCSNNYIITFPPLWATISFRLPATFFKPLLPGTHMPSHIYLSLIIVYNLTHGKDWKILQEFRQENSTKASLFHTCIKAINQDFISEYMAWK